MVAPLGAAIERLLALVEVRSPLLGSKFNVVADNGPED